MLRLLSGCRRWPELRASLDLADGSAYTYLGNVETKLERDGKATREPTFIVNLEVKENQGPVFCLGVGEGVIQDREGVGALQLKVTGLAAAAIQLLEGLKHRKANRSGVRRERGSILVMRACAGE